MSGSDAPSNMAKAEIRLNANPTVTPSHYIFLSIKNDKEAAFGVDIPDKIGKPEALELLRVVSEKIATAMEELY